MLCFHIQVKFDNTSQQIRPHALSSTTVSELPEDDGELGRGGAESEEWGGDDGGGGAGLGGLSYNWHFGDDAAPDDPHYDEQQCLASPTYVLRGSTVPVYSVYGLNV